MSQHNYWIRIIIQGWIGGECRLSVTLQGCFLEAAIPVAFARLLYCSSGVSAALDAAIPVAFARRLLSCSSEVKAALDAAFASRFLSSLLLAHFLLLVGATFVQNKGGRQGEGESEEGGRRATPDHTLPDLITRALLLLDYFFFLAADVDP